MHTLITTESVAAVGLMGGPAVATHADQQEILVLLLKGRSCRAIAGELGVCVPTVKARLMRLYRQAGQHSRPRLR